LIPCEAFVQEFPQPEEEEDSSDEEDNDGNTAEVVEPVHSKSFTPLRKIGKTSSVLSASIAY